MTATDESEHRMEVKERTTEHTLERVDTVTADELSGADVGALEVGEVGFIGHCRCGVTTEIRYSEIAAMSAVATHVIGREASLA